MREQLAGLEGVLVTVRGRVKNLREHPTRPELRNVCLAGVKVFPVLARRNDGLLTLDHIWILASQLKAAGCPLRMGGQIEFTGIVYSYIQKGKHAKRVG